MPLKLVILDMDGVLLSGSKQMYADAFNHALAPYGVSYSLNQFDEYLSDPRNQIRPRSVLERMLPVGRKSELEACNLKAEEFIQANSGKYIFETPGAADTVKKLKAAGFLVAIATNAHREYAAEALSRCGFTGFDLLVTGSDGFKDKGEAARGVMQRLAAKPSQTVYVGDGMNDVSVAKALRCSFIGFVGWNNREQLEGAGAKIVVEKMSDLVSEISRLSNAKPQVVKSC